MPRVWARDDVDKAVETIRAIMDQAGQLPAELVAAYKRTLAASSHGLVGRFYEELAARCPQAVRFFVNSEEPAS